MLALFLSVLALAAVSIASASNANSLFGNRLYRADHVASAALNNITILISIDGFRASYIRNYSSLLPNLISLQKAGVYAHQMLPITPSVTFPDHTTIATGLYPPEHGIVGNNIYDPVLKDKFAMGNPSSFNATHWVLPRAEFIWQTAKKAGLKSSTIFWPLDYAFPIQPDTYLAAELDDKTDSPTRMAQLLKWIPEGNATFYAIHLDDCDEAGHSSGPNGPEILKALALVDGLLGQLIATLKQLQIFDSSSIVIVSDHGMEDVSAQRSVYMDKYTDITQFFAIDEGALIGIWPYDLSTSNVEKIWNDLKLIPHGQMYLRDRVPFPFYYSHYDRIPPIVGFADESWLLMRNSSEPYNGGKPGGTHGFQRFFESMAALFIAHSPAHLRRGEINTMENVHIYPLLCYLLKIDSVCARTQGSLVTFEPFLLRESVLLL